MGNTYETLSSAADRWSVSPRTLRRLIADGRLEAFKLERALRVRPQDVDNCFQSTQKW